MAGAIEGLLGAGVKAVEFAFQDIGSALPEHVLATRPNEVHSTGEHDGRGPSENEMEASEPLKLIA